MVVNEILPGLSLVMLVRNPPEQVAAIARLFGNIADEVIICVDSRVEIDLLSPLVEVSDRLIRVMIDTPYANSSWIVKLAQREWVLIVDGDEVPSRDLLVRLSRLHELSSEVMYAYVGMKWLWPSTSSYLVEEPWRDDPQLRLVRRHARILNWPTGLHEAPKVDGKGVFLPECLYHLDLACNSLEARTEKVQRYNKGDAQPLPGFSTAINDSYYLPEDRGEKLKVCEIPSQDKELVEQVVSAKRIVTNQYPEIPATTISSIRDVEDAWISNETLYSCLMEFIDPPSSALVGMPIRISIRVMNSGSWLWQPHRPDGGIAIGWEISSGNSQATEGRAALVAPLWPNQSVLIPRSVKIPITHEVVTITFRLVDEFRQWFEQSLTLNLQPRHENYDHMS